MTQRLFIATTNKGKLRELKALLAPFPITIITPAELGIMMDYEEVEDDIRKVAKDKALWALGKSCLPSLAEDTSLEVDALRGLPGARAARFFGEGISDTERWRGLLKLLEGVPMERRTARFRCAMALALSDKDVIITEGVLEGLITTEPYGESGFGYDPVFFVPELGKTLAQLSLSEKNSISHRSRAFHALLPNLLRYFGVS